MWTFDSLPAGSVFAIHNDPARRGYYYRVPETVVDGQTINARPVPNQKGSGIYVEAQAAIMPTGKIIAI